MRKEWGRNSNGEDEAREDNGVGWDFKDLAFHYNL